MLPYAQPPCSSTARWPPCKFKMSGCKNFLRCSVLFWSSPCRQAFQLMVSAASPISPHAQQQLWSFSSFSISPERPEAYQYRAPPWHHPHQGNPDSGLRVCGESTLCLWALDACTDESCSFSKSECDHSLMRRQGSTLVCFICLNVLYEACRNWRAQYRLGQGLLADCRSSCCFSRLRLICLLLLNTQRQSEIHSLKQTHEERRRLFHNLERKYGTLATFPCV